MQLRSPRSSALACACAVALGFAACTSEDDAKKGPPTFTSSAGATTSTSTSTSSAGGGGEGGAGGAAGSGGGGGGAATLCGNGAIDGNEGCDGSDLNGKDCSDLGYSAPEGLACTPLCDFALLGCKSTCDGLKLEPGEPCDGSLMSAHSCLEFGYGTPEGLGCASDCTLDPSGCASSCDGVLAETGEGCDGFDLKGLDCTAFGYVDPAGLFCLGDCTLSTIGCAATCGNGVQEPGECENDPPPGAVCTPACTVQNAPVINEILYDTTGVDAGCFVELRGTPGLDLAGYKLRFVDGFNGTEYAPLLELAGAIGPSGYFVVAQDASVAVAPGANSVIDARADLADGADGVQLLYGTTLVDGIGYGVFGGLDPYFVGETAPSVDPDPPAADPQIAVARVPDGSDTNDNSVDFTATTPTPGAANP